MNNQFSYLLQCAAFVMSMLFAQAHAQPAAGNGPPGAGGRKPPAPPAEAIAACAGKAAGASVSFKGRNGETITGICQPMGDTLAAKPAGGPGAQGGKPHGPPPEAVAACAGKSEGALTSFKGREGETVTGTCQLDNGVLAARPAGGGKKNDGGPPPPPQQAPAK